MIFNKQMTSTRVLTSTLLLETIGYYPSRIADLISKMFGTSRTEDINENIKNWNDFFGSYIINNEADSDIAELMKVLNIYSKLLNHIFIETTHRFAVTSSENDSGEINLWKQSQLSICSSQINNLNHLIKIVFDQVTLKYDKLVAEGMEDLDSLSYSVEMEMEDIETNYTQDWICDDYNVDIDVLN